MSPSNIILSFSGAYGYSLPFHCFVVSVCIGSLYKNLPIPHDTHARLNASETWPLSFSTLDSDPVSDFHIQILSLQSIPTLQNSNPFSS